MISRPIYIILSIPSDDECNVGVTQSCQLICLFDQVWLPFGELLRLCFCCVRHVLNLPRLLTFVNLNDLPQTYMDK